MLILNTGGTFNKRYNPLTGMMEVPYDNRAVEKILNVFAYDIEMAGAIYKDSLDMTMDDRKMIASIILASKEKKFVVVHGTDTMHLSAAFMHELLEDQVVVFTGAMIPFEIDPLEATANLAMAIGHAQSQNEGGAYICMQGSVAPHDQLLKNRQTGKFEFVES
ncbi:MAG: asparaginase domain-containing protein [Campylobacterota bacterium]|nr:asparaginase domain-containing protein [Campylobacterota bacterium]